MTQELEAAPPSDRDKLMTTELVPEQILPKVMSTFGLTAAYGYYILHVSSMGLTYGSLIGLVVLFIWFHLAAMVIIAGGELIETWGETVERERPDGHEG